MSCGPDCSQWQQAQACTMHDSTLQNQLAALLAADPAPQHCHAVHRGKCTAVCRLPGSCYRLSLHGRLLAVAWTKQPQRAPAVQSAVC